MAGNACDQCARYREERDRQFIANARLDAEVLTLQSELDEALKLIELQKADLDRYRKAVESTRPNCPERVPEEQLQLAMARVLAAHGEDVEPEHGCANDNDGAGEPPSGAGDKKKKRRHNHGRRRLGMLNLPTKRIEIDPEEVRAVGGKGYRLIGEEVSERIAFQRAGYIRLEFARRKWARIEDGAARVDVVGALAGLVPLALPPVLIAPLPDCVWPRYMADPSAIANIAVSKYSDCLPLNRQETISTRDGFTIARSTQCGWLGGAYKVTRRIVDAMFAEARANSFCIATDATGAPVKSTGGCDNWHVFVFIADRDHIVFRYTQEHTSEAISRMLDGYEGHVLADASNIYDILYRTGGMKEVGCWYHQRKYFWKAIESDPDRAYEALSLIAQLFRVARECEEIPMPDRTGQRAARAGPILELFDRWIAKNRDAVDPRGPLDAAITYYDNQRGALRRFLTDGRLPVHNNGSERALRNLVLGRRNWLYFANETGLKWYVTFRSLIASCALHDLNSQLYLEQVLRLAPHWPVTRIIELAPKYWRRTLGQLNEQQRAILTRPWEMDSQLVDNGDVVVLDAAE